MGKSKNHQGQEQRGRWEGSEKVATHTGVSNDECLPWERSRCLRGRSGEAWAFEILTLGCRSFVHVFQGKQNTIAAWLPFLSFPVDDQDWFSWSVCMTSLCFSTSCMSLLVLHALGMMTFSERKIIEWMYFHGFG